MDYQSAVEVFFKPAKAPTPIGAVANARPARRLRDACEPIAMHAVWSRRTNERLAELGLNFLTSYVWGRAASLGEPPTPVVFATFAAFDRGLVTSLYEEGRRLVGRKELLAARDEATIASLTEILAGEEVEAVVKILRGAIEVADPTGRPLFAGLSARPWPTEAVGQLWRVCELIREHRGDSHIAAYITAGLGPIEMNMLTELFLEMPLGTYSASRAWSEEATAQTVKGLETQGLVSNGNLTPKGRELREEIEAQTDRMEQPLVEALGNDLSLVISELNRWSEKCIEAKAFPPDEYKRAAG